MDSGSFGKICYATALRTFVVTEVSLSGNVGGENTDQPLNYLCRAGGSLVTSHQKW
jgi:hypothetical protein